MNNSKHFYLIMLIISFIIFIYHLFLSISAPPTSIEIVGHAPHAKVEVRENQELSLQCVVANAKPAAEIVWYRGNVELQPGECAIKIYFATYLLVKWLSPSNESFTSRRRNILGCLLVSSYIADSINPEISGAWHRAFFQ